MSTDWCEFNDMPKVGCEHCHPAPAEEKPKLTNLQEANYPGTCAGCGKGIIAFMDIIGRVEGEKGWYHYGCGS